MTTVINLFTKQIITCDAELIPGKIIQPDERTSVKVGVKSNDWYEVVRAWVEARFGDNLPRHFETCMAVHQSQPYMHGDCHNVEYRKIGSLINKRRFNAPLPVPCKVTIESCSRTNGVLTLGKHCKLGIDEPFMWMDRKYEITLNFLKSLPNDTKLIINTRSDLVATGDYQHELQRLDVVVNILYTSRNEELNRRVEPGAPSYKRRIAAVKSLVEAGIKAFIVKHNKPNQRKAA